MTATIATITGYDALTKPGAQLASKTAYVVMSKPQADVATITGYLALISTGATPSGRRRMSLM